MVMEAAPSAPPETPTPVAAPDVAEATTQDDAPETPLAEGTEPGSEEQREALPEKWHEHPEVEAHISERLKGYVPQTEHEKQLEFRLAQQRTDLLDQRNRDIEVAKADRVILAAEETFQTIRQNLAQGVEDPDMAEAEFKKLLKDTDGWAQIYGQEIVRTSEKRGADGGIHSASLELYEGLSQDAVGELSHYVTTEINPKAVEGKMDSLQAYKAMRQKRDELFRLQLEKELASTIEARLKDEAKAKENAGEPGPVAITGRVGTATSFEELEHIYASGEASPDQEQRYRQMRRERGL